MRAVIGFISALFQFCSVVFVVTLTKEKKKTKIFSV